MSGRLSDDAMGLLLDVIFGGVTNPWAGDTHYMALSTTGVEPDGTFTEATGGSYARVAVTNNATNFPTAADRSKANGTAVVFPTLSDDIGTALAVVVMTASSGGVMLAWADITGGLPLLDGLTPRIEIGDLVIIGPSA